MGGRGSGGSRAGAGRKPKSQAEAALTDARGRLLNHPSAAQVPMLAPIEEFDAPNDLTMDERRVWLELAPFAFQNRTLTRATALMFTRLCRNLVLEQDLSASADKGGSNHRGLIQRVDAELLRFNLSPNGKALYEAQPERMPASKLNRFVTRG